MDKIEQVIASIQPLDEKAMEEARKRQDSLTKPQGSLGQLESLSIQIAGIRGNPRPQIAHKVIFTLAGDHGITGRVSAIPLRHGTDGSSQGGEGINFLLVLWEPGCRGGSGLCHPSEASS
jgi:nicotinate-nucleotide--dimethylbenzimidazole phosphoribosyltransferase